MIELKAISLFFSLSVLFNVWFEKREEKKTIRRMCVQIVF